MQFNDNEETRLNETSEKCNKSKMFSSGESFNRSTDTDITELIPSERTASFLDRKNYYHYRCPRKHLHHFHKTIYNATRL